jgi:hypothetical protein
MPALDHWRHIAKSVLCPEGYVLVLNCSSFKATGESELSGLGVRRGKAALSSGCKSHPANAPAGSNRSSHGGNEMAEAFG